MTNIDQIRQILNQNNEQGKNVVIIASIDDQQKIISCLSPTNSQFNKRILDQFESQSLPTNTKTTNAKKRKGDLTCVICGGSASGYNFNQITCESCKAFFRRNALQSIEKTKCLAKSNNFFEILCPIRFDIKTKCQRCRLLKCFQSGMNKDHILTTEEKLMKQQRLEENRRLHSTTQFISKSIKTEPLLTTIDLQSVNGINKFSSNLTENDRTLLNSIDNAYQTALQSTPPVSTFVQLELAPDRMSAYMNTLDIQNYAVLKLIQFIRQIEQFEQLNEHDRFILVKYNLTLLLMIRYAETFDPTRELIYMDSPVTNNSPSDVAFAQHYKSLYILCYGYEFNCLAMLVFHTIYQLVNHDATLTQLLLLNMLFLKGLSAVDDQEPSLNDNMSVFYAHSKYADLLFRYLIDKSSFESAAIKMMRITEIFIKIQRLMRDFQNFIKSKVDINCVNPLMKSILNFT